MQPSASAHFPSLLVLLQCLFVASLLPGCAAKSRISQTQCEVGDWETLGQRDGALGRRSSQLLELQEGCAAYGVTPDRETYMRGWRDGVRDYCNPSNALSVGESGRGHNNICPDDLRDSFTAAFDEGRALYAARTRVSELESGIARDTARLEEVRSGLISTAAAQLNPLLSPTRRADLIAELQALNDEKKRLLEDIPRNRLELVDQERELDVLERNASATRN